MASDEWQALWHLVKTIEDVHKLAMQQLQCAQAVVNQLRSRLDAVQTRTEESY